MKKRGINKILQKYDINFENVNQVFLNLSINEKPYRKKDFESADKMRESILGVGISLEDGTDSGWSWKNSWGINSVDALNSNR